MIGWRQSIREIRRQRGRSLLTLLSVSIAVAAIVAVLGATDATVTSYRKVFETLSGGADLEIVARGGGSFPESAVAFAEQLPEVKAVSPVLRRATVLYARGKKAKLLAVGMPLGSPEASEGLNITAGHMPNDAGQIALDASLAASLDIKVGDSVRLLTTSGLRSQTVAGLLTLTSGEQMHQGGMVIAPLEHLQKLFRAPGKIDALHLYLARPNDATKTIAAIEPRLPKSLVAEPPATSDTLVEQMMALVSFSLDFGGALSIVTAVFIALSVFLMSVSERRRQLSILRAVGATRGQIVRMISVEALVVGIAGTLIGAPLGVFGGQFLSGAMSEMLGVGSPGHANMLWPLVAGGVAGPVICVFGSCYPALVASRISPLEGMRPAVTLEHEASHGGITLLGCAGIAASIAIAIASVRAGGPLWVAIGSILMLLVSVVFLLPAGLAPCAWLLHWPLRRWASVEADLSRRLVLRHTQRSSLTTGVLFIAVAYGVSFSNIAISVTGDVNGWLERTMTADFLIRTMMPDMSGQDPAAMSETLLAELAKRPEVESVEGLCVLRADVNGEHAIIAGRDFCRLHQAPLNVPGADTEKLLDAVCGGEVVLGSVLAERCKLRVGDTARLTVGDRAHEARVAAVSNDYLAGGSVAYLDRGVAEHWFSVEGIDSLLVKSKGPPDDRLRAELQGFASEHGLILQSFADLRRQLDTMVAGVTAGIWVMLTLGLLVGAFGIMNMLTMNVLEQTRELGMLRAIGMERRQVLRTVLGQAALIGLVGVIAGATIGMALSRTISLSMAVLFGRPLVWSPRPELALLVASLALAVVLGAAAAPALRAARLSPIEAMRQE